MELITGRKALDNSLDDDSAHLVTWFKRMQIQNEFRQAVDPAIDLNDAEISRSVSIVSDLAGHCSVRDPHQRPDMSHVVNILSSLAEKWQPSRSSLDDILGMDNVNEGWRRLLTLPMDTGASGPSMQYGDSIINSSSSVPPFGASTSNTQSNALRNQETADGR